MANLTQPQTPTKAEPTTKKVELLHALSDGVRCLKPGTVLELPLEDADRMTRAGAALEAEPDAKVTGKLGVPKPETAALPATKEQR